MSTQEPDQRDQLRARIAERIRQLRRSRGWTQRELAERLGSSQARLSQLERAQGSFTAEQLLQVMQLFNVDVLDFVPPGHQSEEGELINALIRHGARHLREVAEVVPTERYRLPGDLILAVLMDPGSARMVTALAPVVVWSIDAVNLHKVQRDLSEVGRPHRLGWLAENTASALDSLRPGAPGPLTQWGRRSRRAELLLEDFLSRVQPEPDLALDAFDHGIRTRQTLARRWEAASAPCLRWRLVSALRPEDFARALEAARGSD